MPLPDEIRGLADRIVTRLDGAREFDVHSRQAWHLVRWLARKGRPIGIIDLGTKRSFPTGDLASGTRRYSNPAG
jgi:hypothetical protein